MSNPLIDLETARALVARGWSVVPTASDAEKRPQGNFATAKSWRDFSDRLPTDSELLGWFGPKPRRGGVVLHKGQLCVDRDTKDSLPDGSAPWEETDHGSHEFFQCTAETKPSHDHDAKIDYLTYGSFVRLANPQCLLDWEGDLPRWEDGMTKPAVEPAVETAAVPLSGGTIRDTLIAQGWKPIGIHGNREDFSRPGAAHPTRCDALLRGSRRTNPAPTGLTRCAASSTTHSRPFSFVQRRLRGHSNANAQTYTLLHSFAVAGTTGSGIISTVWKTPHHAMPPWTNTLPRHFCRGPTSHKSFDFLPPFYTFYMFLGRRLVRRSLGGGRSLGEGGYTAKTFSGKQVRPL